MSDTSPSLTLVRRIKASPARVFAAWVQPEQMTRWWGADRGPVLSAEADARTGGGFRVRFRKLDGSLRECHGTYRAVEPERRLVFTLQWVDAPELRSLVTVELRAIAEGTELTLTNAQFPDEASRDSHRDGWNGALDNLEAFLVPATL